MYLRNYFLPEREVWLKDSETTWRLRFSCRRIRMNKKSIPIVRGFEIVMRNLVISCERLYLRSKYI